MCDYYLKINEFPHEGLENYITNICRRKRGVPPVTLPIGREQAVREENLFTVGVRFPIPIIFVDARFKSIHYLRYELNSFPIEKMPELRIILMAGLQG